MLIDKISLAVKEFVSTDEKQFSLVKVKIEKDRTLATDGIILGIIDNTKERTNTDYPAIKNFESNDNPCCINDKTCTEISNFLPKKNKTDFPILNFASTSSTENELQIGISNLESSRIIIENNQTNYPDINNNLKSYYDNQSNYCLVKVGIDYLEKIVKVVKDIKKNSQTGQGTDKGIVLKISKENPLNPMYFKYEIDKDRKLEGLVMPIK